MAGVANSVSPSAPPALLLLRGLSTIVTDQERRLFDRIVVKPLKTGALRKALAELTQGSAAQNIDLQTPIHASSLAPGLRVLLADDNVVNLKVVTHLLKNLNVHVHTVSNGIEALQALADHDSTWC